MLISHQCTEGNYNMPVQSRSRPESGAGRGTHSFYFHPSLYGHPSTISLLYWNSFWGGWGRGQGLPPQSRLRTASGFSGNPSISESSSAGAAGPREEGVGLGLHGSFSRGLGSRRQLVLFRGWALGWGQAASLMISPAPVNLWFTKEGRAVQLWVDREQGLSHCQTSLQRTLSVSTWWASVLCLLPPRHC